MEISQKQKSETVLAALKIIDPDATLTLGSPEQEIVMDHVSSLIDRKGPKEALKEIEATKDHLRAQIAQMEM